LSDPGRAAACGPVGVDFRQRHTGLPGPVRQTIEEDLTVARSARPARSAKNTLGGVEPPVVVRDDRSLTDAPLAQEIALPVFPDEDSAPWIGPGGAKVVDAYAPELLTLLEREKGTGRAGEIVSLPVLLPDVDVEQILLVGIGDGLARDYRRAGAALARRTKGRETVASTVTATADDAGMRGFVEGLVLASYEFSRKSAGPKPAPPRRTVTLAATPADRQPALERGLAVARAGWRARDLIHTPSNEKNPQWLAEQAQRLAQEAGLSVRVRDENALASEGFGGLAAVGQGSATPPRLIEVGYLPRGASRRTPHVVLVGKGITYDTGGLSIKPNEAMVPMKTDMSGGAVVMSVVAEAAALGVPVKITALVAAAENAVSGSAQRPGDVLRQYDGTTVEVRNTDAEGRLVLADAIAYAVADLKPDAVVDVATLTGAATAGLGRQRAALYATDEALGEALRVAGEAAGERLWRMPLVDDYREALDTPIADVCHIETTHVGGGSITAALFLERFARGVPWAHLDIAGPGRADADAHEVTKGGTGFGARLLLYWLETRQPLDGVSPPPPRTRRRARTS